MARTGASHGGRPLICSRPIQSSQRPSAHPKVLLRAEVCSHPEQTRHLPASCLYVRMYTSYIDGFEWDRRKAVANLRRHGVGFVDAVEVFFDERALTIPEQHPDEERFVTVGSDALRRILVVVYCWREDRIRIISARKATTHERRQYEGLIS